MESFSHPPPQKKTTQNILGLYIGLGAPSWSSLCPRASRSSLLPTQLCCLGFLTLLWWQAGLWAPMGSRAQDSLSGGHPRGCSPTPCLAGLGLAECMCTHSCP